MMNFFKKYVIQRMRAVKYALAGLHTAWNKEIAFRLEVMMSVILIPYAFFLEVSSVEKILLIASVLLILIVELINSAIENAVTLFSEKYHELAKAAKDQGAAAVFLAIINMFIVWVIILS